MLGLNKLHFEESLKKEKKKGKKWLSLIKHIYQVFQRTGFLLVI